MSEILDAVLAANARYASTFGEKGDLAAPPVRGLGILTCMDARLDPAGIAGLREGDAQILRNAGGRASNDAIRSLVISCKLLGTREWVVIHHTGCGMESLTDATQRSRFTASLRPENAGPPVAQADGDADEFFEADDLLWLEIRGVRERLSAAVNRIRTHPLLPPGVLVHGLLYDVATGRLEVVDQANAYQATP
jgi:carbonic anhydrase